MTLEHIEVYPKHFLQPRQHRHMFSRLTKEKKNFIGNVKTENLRLIE